MKLTKRKATSYWLSEDSKLYRRSFSGPYLLCVHPDQTELLLEEMHEGICGSHTGGRSLAHRAITQGKFCAEEVASMAKESACALPLLGICSKLKDSNFVCIILT